MMSPLVATLKLIQCLSSTDRWKIVTWVGPKEYRRQWRDNFKDIDKQDIVTHPMSGKMFSTLTKRNETH